MRILTFRKRAGERSVTRHAINAERERLHVAKGDTVRVLRGDDKGKEGKVLRVFPKTGRITIEGVNIVKKHRKARRAEEQSQIMEMPAPVHASNVMLLDPKSGAEVTIPNDPSGPLLVRVIKTTADPYVGKLMSALRQAGFVDSVRGRGGGYVLSRPASEISVEEVLNALGEPLFPTEYCNSHPGALSVCAHQTDCSIRSIWQAAVCPYCSSTLANSIAAGRIKISEQELNEFG